MIYMQRSMSIKMKLLEKIYRNVKKNRNRHLKLTVLCIITWAVFSYFCLYFYLDKSIPEGIYNPMSKVKLIQLVQNNVPNLPERYFRNPDDMKFLDDHDPCEKYPSLEDLAFNNDFWQEWHIEDDILYLYTAYYDDRPLTRTPEYQNTTKDSKHALVRILGLINKPEVKVNYYCQLWFKDTMDHALVKMSSIDRLTEEFVDEQDLSNSLIPYMISCPVPAQYKSMVPVSVSLLEQPCQNITNNVQIVSEEAVTRDGNKENFCVCILGLEDDHFPDFFNRFIEWMEMLALLGVDKVVLYEQHIKSDIYPLLYYYIRKGLLELIELKMPEANVTAHAVHVNHLSYNDCLYKSIYSYNYITTLRINEIFIPKKILTTWKEIINLVSADSRISMQQEPSTYTFRNAYFTEAMQTRHGRNSNIPQYLLMQHNVYRSTQYSPEQVYVGSIHDTSQVTVLGIVQGIATCINNNCFTGRVDPREGLMHRYQKSLSECVGESAKSCALYGNTTTLDRDIYKYRKDVITLFKDVINFLNFTG